MTSKGLNIGIIGCGWLGKQTGIKLKILNDEISCITSSPNRIKELEAVGISPTVLDLNGNEDALLFDWLEHKDVVLVSLSPSKLEKYCEVISKVAKMLNADQNMVFVSSTSVYEDKNGVVNELSALAPSKRSGTTLIDTEKNLFKILQKRLTIVRMGGLVGNNRQPAKYFAGKKELDGGNQYINFIHLEDASHLLSFLIIYEIFGEIINGVCSVPILKKEYYPYATRKLGLKPASFLPTDEKPIGKLVSNFKSQQLGMIYKYPNPLDFPELL